MVELLAAERPPGVRVGVDVDHPDGFVGLHQRLEDRERDRVIATSGQRHGTSVDDAANERLDVVVDRLVVVHATEAEILLSPSVSVAKFCDRRR